MMLDDICFFFRLCGYLEKKRMVCIWQMYQKMWYTHKFTSKISQYKMKLFTLLHKMTPLMSYLVFSHHFKLTSSSTTDFCRLSCGQAHSVCKRKPCGPNKHCGIQFKSFPLNNDEREIVVHKHNTFRSDMANTNMKLWPAANMQVMSYSRELEFIAQCFANSCMADGVDKCRSTTEYEEVGQNIYVLHKYLGQSTEREILSNALHHWQSEFIFFKSEWIDNFKLSEISQVKNFMQLIWAETTYVGCGRARMGGEIITKYVIICNYSPSGVIEGQPVYIKGNPCKSCEEHCSNELFLCGETQSLARDKWVAPFIMEAGAKRTIETWFAWCILILLVILKVISGSFLLFFY